MKTLILGDKTPLQNGNGLCYKGIAFDGCFFYLTSPACCKVIQYDKYFCETNCFETCRSYTSLCYDIDGNCFWASTNTGCCKLYKLDLCFNEIDCLTVCLCKKYQATITGVSYDCHKKRLIVSFANCIVAINKNDEEDFEVLTTLCTSVITGVLSVCPNYIVTEVTNCKQYISIYNEDLVRVCKLEVPKEYIVEEIVFYPCGKHCDDKYHFYILATKNGCYSYVLNWEIDCLCFHICRCNYKICHKKCPPHPHPLPPCKDQACNDIIESVALIETALSHILNAEGEKLQKVIASTDDIDKILCANKAINETIVNATHLEIVLHDKLESIKEICCVSDKKC